MGTQSRADSVNPRGKVRPLLHTKMFSWGNASASENEQKGDQNMAGNVVRGNVTNTKTENKNTFDRGAINVADGGNISGGSQGYHAYEGDQNDDKKKDKKK